MDSESRQATSEASRLTGSRKRSPSTTSEDSTRPGKKPRLDSARTENVPAPQRGPFFSYPANSVDLSEQTVGELLKDDSDESEDSIPDTTHLPLRMLDSFTFFTGDDSGPERQILGLEQLEHGRRVQIIGYGDVRSVDADPEEEGALDEDHEDAEENSQTYRYRYFPCLLGPVIEWWTGDGVTNFDMYIRTQSAWYLLETPSAVYHREVVGPRVSHLSFDLPPQERTQRRPNVPMEGPTESDITDARGVKKAFYKVLSEQGGTSYEIGDCVAIKMGQFRDQRTFDPPASGNKLADESW
ncbi:hypothetical protein FRC15_002178 [Serendipita sp. 397]|nr:hypothetical protein FRC15_002178 [Serendipita sp. 397]